MANTINFILPNKIENISSQRLKNDTKIAGLKCSQYEYVGDNEYKLAHENSKTSHSLTARPRWFDITRKPKVLLKAKT